MNGMVRYQDASLHPSPSNHAICPSSDGQFARELETNKAADLPGQSQMAASESDSSLRSLAKQTHILCCRETPIWKRLFDIVVSLFLILMLSPLLLSIAAYIWLRDGGPVFFWQKRLGIMGRNFEICKFRTLTCSPSATADHRQFVAQLSAGNSVTSKPDLSDRLIPGGAFLRSTSLDELPQLWNILQGDMSLIGPRPDVLQWNDYQPWQLRRFEVVPGVTGLWQVSGKNLLTFNEMIDKDIEYVDQRSWRLDLVIAIKTFGLLLQRSNQ